MRSTLEASAVTGLVLPLCLPWKSSSLPGLCLSLHREKQRERERDTERERERGEREKKKTQICRVGFLPASSVDLGFQSRPHLWYW